MFTTDATFKANLNFFVVQSLHSYYKTDLLYYNH